MSHKVFQMPFSQIYSLLLQKALKKGRNQEEVDTVIQWLTGYHQEQIHAMLETSIDYEHFFLQAPCLNEKRFLIKGSICGVKLETIEDPMMQNIRYLDKLIDELAKGKNLDKILRK
ncbi:DUF2200 domain-containing protein [Massilimicrobiota timonensis]|uniref:DUF2200 domain-containing protein n=1 Tax=Massilimicrobiota timonensis TaxID=1776392 RepID=A0ABT7UJD2_9FIRM|nr:MULTISPECIES: DUF2200 domain-containing protein [Massilimicrobiota]MDM8196253.1 DUF2200 domain-containing protein [Massilimicrobiota timonensis]